MMKKMMFIKKIISTVLLMFFLFSVCTTVEAKDKKTLGYYESATRSYFREHKWGAGKKLLDEALPIYPDDSQLNELMGQYLCNRNQYDKARFFLIKAVRDNDKNAQAYQLLISLEEEQGNYSVAICYVNDLLEMRPYSKSLWLQKIRLYLKQGNDAEADRLLARLCKIYPTDVKLRQQYHYRMEEQARILRKKGDLSQAISNLETLVKEDSHNAENYFSLCNLYLQQGNKNAALCIAERGVMQTGSVLLARKKASILAEEHRYSEAIAFIKSYMRLHSNSGLNSFLNELEKESAYESLNNDPYVQFGKLYEKSHSLEALNYLLNTSMSRQYNDDALFYIHEMKKRQGVTFKLVYKEAIVQKRLGNTRKWANLLETALRMQPNNKGVIEELSCYHLEKANQLMMAKLYEEAIPDLDFVISKSKDRENLCLAWNKKYSCLYELGRYDKALTLLNIAGQDIFGHNKWLVRRAELMDKTGQTDNALSVIEKELSDFENTDYELYSGCYEEMAVPYIKKLIAKGAIRKANSEAIRLVRLCPESYYGLLYSVNTSAQLHKNDEYNMYLDQALESYPDDITFRIKKSTVYNRAEDYDHALNLLRPYLDSLSGDTLLVRAFSVSSALKALKLLKDNHSWQAMAVVDSALYYNSDDVELLYDKGLIYEKLHLYDSAYVYQKYNDNDVEVREHLKELMFHCQKNCITLGYLHSRVSDNNNTRAIASIGYSLKNIKNTYSLSVNYSGREGYANKTTEENSSFGGAGVQVVAEWTHYFKAPISVTIGGGWSNMFFPRRQLYGSVGYELNNGWGVDLHGGYRSVEASSERFKPSTEATDDGEWQFDGWNKTWTNLYNVGIGVSKNLGNFSLGVKGDGVIVNRKLFFNISSQGKYYPNENNHLSFIFAQVGAGTAPESAILDTGLPGTFSHMNSSVGMGYHWMLTCNMSLLVQGDWFTFYSQNNFMLGTAESYSEKVSTRYKNLFNIYLQLNISF